MKTSFRPTPLLSRLILALALSAISFLSASQGRAAAKPAANANTALVISVRGSATHTDVAGTESRLKRGMALSQGATITTGPTGFVVLRIADRQNVLRVRSNSVLTIETLSVREVAGESVINTKMKLTKGSLLGNVKKLSAASNFEVQTAKGVAGIRGTVFEVLAVGIVRCFRGQVTMVILVAAVQSEITIGEGQQLNLGARPAPNQPPRVIAIPLDAQTGAQLEINALRRIVGEQVEGAPHDLPEKFRRLIKEALKENPNADNGNVNATELKKVIQRIVATVNNNADTADLNNLRLIEQVVAEAVRAAIQDASRSPAAATTAGAAAASYLDSVIVVNGVGSNGGTVIRPILDPTTAGRNALDAARLAASVYDGLIGGEASPQQAFAGALAACAYLAGNPGDAAGARNHAQTVAANVPAGDSIPVDNVNQFFVEKIISPNGED
jgi:hypothetical protein